MTDTKAAFLIALIVLVAGTLMWFALLWVHSVKCETRWADSGMESKFSAFTGCRIQIEPGKWIPDDRYRELPE
jgi:hypothetical protein